MESIRGKDAYEVYLDDGGDLSFNDWFNSLRSPDAYEASETSDDETNWLQSLKGESIFNLSSDNLNDRDGDGDVDELDYLDSIKGEQGAPGPIPRSKRVNYILSHCE